MSQAVTKSTNVNVAPYNRPINILHIVLNLILPYFFYLKPFSCLKGMKKEKYLKKKKIVLLGQYIYLVVTWETFERKKKYEEKKLKVQPARRAFS